MDARLARLFDRIESQRAEVIGQVERLEPGAGERQPAAGGWSISQVIQHLAQADELSVGYITKKMQGGTDVPRAGLGAAFRTLLLETVLASPVKFKAPARLSGAPPNPPLSESLERWRQGLEGWRELLEGFPPELLDRAVYRHPRAGYQTIGQALRFVVAHQRRHAGQIRRLAAAG